MFRVLKRATRRYEMHAEGGVTVVKRFASKPLELPYRCASCTEAAKFWKPGWVKKCPMTMRKGQQERIDAALRKPKPKVP